MTARRLTRPGVLVVEFEGCKRCLVVESNNEGITIAATGKPKSKTLVSYDDLVVDEFDRTLKEFLR